MRNVRVAFRVVALIAVFTLSAVGQQVPDPQLTLAEAARTNNYPGFEATYAAGPDGAQAFAELHRFWKWSLETPVGGFYGVEMHAKFASQYPGYAEYIADYAIVDSHGNVFYPSAETRRFLLQEALKGNVPKPRVAAAAPAAVVARVSRRATKPAVVAPKPEPAPSPVIVTTPRVAPAAPAPVVARGARRSTEQTNNFGPSFALIIAGLIGAGLLTLMLRTPSEAS
jgi:hypothetical protein